MSKAPHSADSDDTARKKKRGASLLVWILVAMLVAGLGGFGIENFGSGTTAIGRVGKTEITANDYARDMRAQVNALSRQFGTPISMSDARSFGIDRQVLAGLVNRAALDDEAARVGLSVGDAVVAGELAKIAAFQGVNGSFDRETYGRTLSQNGTNEATFEEGLRRDVARSLLTGAVSGGVVAPAALTDTLLSWAGEKRGFTMLILDESALDAPLPPPTEAEIQAYYDANIASYTRPVAKRIQYAALLPATLAPSVEVSEDSVKADYQARLSEFVIPEKRLVERLVYPDEAAAAEAKARLDAGTSFEDLVRDRGLTLEDIDMGDVTRAELGDAGEAVFALQSPGVVGPLPSSLGPALYRMNAILMAQETTLDEARPQLVAALQVEAAAKQIDAKLEAVEDALAGGASLEDLAKEFAMTLATIDYAPGADDNDPITLSAAFRSAAEKLAEGDFPEAILLEDGGLVSLQLLETVPPTPVALDKIRDKVAEATRLAALTTALGAKAAAVKAAVDAGATLESQGAVTSVEPKDRQSSLDQAPPSVLEAAFQMQLAELRLIEEPGFVGLVRLDSIAPADATSPDGSELREVIEINLRRALSEDVTALYTSALAQKAGITLDQPMIDAVNVQLGN